MEYLTARVREAEALPDVTKTSIKNAVFKDKSIDWRRLRLLAAQRPDFRPQNWKADLINTLLSRTFPHGGARRHGGRRSGGGGFKAFSSPPPPAPGSVGGGNHHNTLPSQPSAASRLALANAMTPHDPHASSVVLAVLHLLRLLPPRLRRALVRHSLDDNAAAASLPAAAATDQSHRGGVPSTAVRGTAGRYVAILGRRRVRSWKGQTCFTGRILARTGYLDRSAGDIVSACATLLRWWDAEGRPATLCLRPANAFTAHLPLLYTTLTPHDPLHDAACRQLHHECTWPTGGPHGGTVFAGGTTGTSTHGGDCAAIPAEDAWRAFTRRFPVLGVYQPIWFGDRDPACAVLSNADIDPEAWEELWRHSEGVVGFDALGAALHWPMDTLREHGGEAVVTMLARTLQPSEPWEHWVAVVAADRHGYRRPAVWHLRRAAALLLGFGDICSSVLEAIRLPARLRGEAEPADDAVMMVDAISLPVTATT